MQENALATAVLDEASDPLPVTPPVSVAPLNYTQLRLLAEYTAVLEGDVDFVLTPEHTLRVTNNPTDDDVLIPAAQGGKFPKIVVELFAEYEGIVSPPLRLGERSADALFWSDAAVQKFLIPYVASCAGGNAAHSLARLRGAWNEFDPTLVRVYALAHMVEYEKGAPLSLDHAIQVVFAEVPPPDAPVLKLQRLPLGTFLHRYPPAMEIPSLPGRRDDGAPGHVSYYRGADSSRFQHPDYRTLRAAAEYACSLCHDPKYFTFRENEVGFHPEPGLPLLGAGDFVIPVFTSSTPACRPSLYQVTCRLGQSQPEVVNPAVDAMFWSDAAVAQFMYPYYASKLGVHEGPAELYWLFNTWTGTAPDLRPGPDRILPPDAAEWNRDLADAAAPEPEVVGLVHFPTSEWLPEVQGVQSSVLHDVGVMFTQGGSTHVVPAEQFIGRYRVRE